MTAFNITDQKSFTRKLFLEEAFDAFEVSRVDITTGQTLSLDGTLQMEYYDEKEREAFQEASRHCVLWGAVRPFCFSFIRGKKTPLSFRIAFLLSKEQMGSAPFAALSPLTKEGMGYVLNLTFTREGLRCTSGTWNKTFSLDKEPERAWDSALTAFLEGLSVGAEEIL